MNTSLPQTMRRFVHERIQEEGFANSSEYVRGLIRREQARIEANLQRAVREGFESGDAG